MGKARELLIMLDQVVTTHDGHNMHRNAFFKGKELNGNCRPNVTLLRQPVDRPSPRNFKKKGKSR